MTSLTAHKHHKTIGFIITRCVKTIAHSSYWIECCTQIKVYHPKASLIILDDGSLPELVKEKDEVWKSTHDDVHIIHAPPEYQGRGELLALWYLVTQPHNLDVAVFIHDSMFLHTSLTPVISQTENVTFLFEFGRTKPEWLIDFHSLHTSLLQTLPLHIVADIEELQNTGDWAGCFGAACVIDTHFAKLLEQRYSILKLMNVITDRPGRCCYERIFALCCQHLLQRPVSGFFGDIHNVPKAFTYTFQQYLHDKYYSPNHAFQGGLVKVWSGR
jgi:hypothetical protein